MSKVVRPRSMKYSTPASCAPGVSSLGIMREVMASISLASSAPKNANLAGAADCAAWRACVAAARRAGQCAETQRAESPPVPCARKRRRLTDASISSNLDRDSANVSGQKRSVKDFLAASAENSEAKWFCALSARPTKARQECCFLQTRTIVCLPFSRKQTAPFRRPRCRKPRLRGQLPVVYDAAHLNARGHFAK